MTVRHRTPAIAAAAFALLTAPAWLGPAWHARRDGQAPARADDASHAPGRTAGGDAGLDAACQQMGGWVWRLLGPECRVIVRPPLVIAGDLPEAELMRCYREEIAPAAEAMAETYFTTPPDEPITLLLFGSDASYTEHARRLLGRKRVSRCGHYRPHLRMVIVNTTAGAGPLRHELTHALMAFDFPGAPDWLAEGLASLHECCRRSAGPPGLEGAAGRRLPVLREAIRQDRLRPLRSLLGDGDFRRGPAAVNYAQARYLCLYLQHRGLLRGCYRELRDGRADDPSGETTVRRVFGGRPWAEIEADFRRWVMELGR